MVTRLVTRVFTVAFQTASVSLASAQEVYAQAPALEQLLVALTLESVCLAGVISDVTLSTTCAPLPTILV